MCYNHAMRLFDTHAHLSDAAFDADREALSAALPEKGVFRVMDVCCALGDWPRTEALLRRFPFVYGAAGIHPESAADFTGADIDKLSALFSREEKLLAWGEIGLDYHYEDAAPRDVQRACFASQLEAAQERSIPVVLHIREAFGDCMDILRAHRAAGLAGEMHCFSGSVEIARECLDMGLYIAFGGAVTFKNANKLLDAARYVPTDRLLLETDCPYMAPTPHRGKRCDPSMLTLTLARLAELRGEDMEALGEATWRNACAMLGLDPN